MVEITVSVTVICASADEVAKAEEILNRYSFKAEGLMKLDKKIREKDWIVYPATKDFMIAK